MVTVSDEEMARRCSMALGAVLRVLEDREALDDVLASADFGDAGLRSDEVRRWWSRERVNYETRSRVL